MAEGTIVVNVSTAGEIIPVSEANIFIYEKTIQGDNLLAVRTTNQSGLSEPVTITTPDESESKTPNQEKPVFKSVDIRVEHPNYYTLFIRNAQIFADVRSIQRAGLVPLSIPSGEKEKGILILPQNL